VNVHLFALDVPPVSHLFEWQSLGAGFSKAAIVMILALISVFVLFGLGSRDQALVPTGFQNVAEAGYELIEKNIADEVMGHEGHKWVPYFSALFFFIFFCNIWEIVPVIQFPATSRFAVTLLLALITYVPMIAMGIKAQGLRYFADIIWPPGIPLGFRPLVGIIELFSKIVLRPFSLAVRLFANMVAGHVLLAVAAIMSAALWTAGPKAIALPGPIFLGIAMTGFEILVAVLQAYIFTMLTAVYLNESLHPEH
jgi:F-type H+-transporting ATPase subunit a